MNNIDHSPTEQEIKRFIKAIGEQLLRKIEEAEDPISFIVKQKQSVIIEILPKRQDNGSWNAFVRYYKKARFPFQAPKLLNSTLLEIGIVSSHDNAELASSVARALNALDSNTLQGIVRTKEPLTFSFVEDGGDLKQVETLITGNKSTFIYDTQIC